MYVLIPRTFYQKRYFRYLLLLALSTWGVLGTMIVINKLFIDEHLLVPRPAYNVLLGITLSTLILVPFFLISTSLKLFKRWVAE